MIDTPETQKLWEDRTYFFNTLYQSILGLDISMSSICIDGDDGRLAIIRVDSSILNTSVQKDISSVLQYWGLELLWVKLGYHHTLSETDRDLLQTKSTPKMSLLPLVRVQE